MCLSPSFVWVLRGPAYEKIPVPCHGCWQCRASRLNDYVGRCLCEAVYSKRVTSITLTYGPRDDLADKIITPEHFQKFIRALRRRGHTLRYIAAAEYGAKKGRAHFHAILFWGNPKPNRKYPNPTISPDMPQKENFHFAKGIWDHGYAFADTMSPNEISERAIAYPIKYLLKEQDTDTWMTLSKKPPLGTQFFLDKADRDAALGVFPASFNYTPPASTKGRQYLLTGATKRFYLERLIDQMAIKHNVPYQRLNEWTHKAIEKLEKWQWQREYLDAMSPEENIGFLMEKLDMERLPETKTAMAVARNNYWAERDYSEKYYDYKESLLKLHPNSVTYEKAVEYCQEELTRWLGSRKTKGR